ncbi:hypothetical protein [Altibacter sp. HG106]|uniref:hypothetical protein n=1 Tax=Altibacter sp. HG106 TaxID=3023937 RepID=UPI002350C8C6|nr:hypothetical protein [Altibacter sp. HG106]MDC7995865.1 hypothetical protein [Altibacter sp. HG106]
MKIFSAFLLTFLVLLSCKNETTQIETNEAPADPAEEAAMQIAQAHGLNNWEEVTEISFTFNVDRGTQHFERSYVWRPKEQEVTSFTANDTLTYIQSRNLDSLQQQRDQAFVNDSYWLLAPLKMIWDDGTTRAVEQAVVAPISQDTLNKITLTYTGEGGYTPGDAYDFYYEPDFTIKEWVFRKGNDSVPTMATTYEDYKNINGMNIPTMHQDSTGAFKLYFTNLSIKK